MGQILHGSVRTTAATRRAIQHSQESMKVLSARHGINEKTVMKWNSQGFVEDAPMRPKNPASTVLSPEQEAAVVAFRRYTLLPLDDCLYALQASIPGLTRSNLHRCLQKRHGIDHRLTKIKHPWTNGQVERMNQTLKEATVKTYYYQSTTPEDAYARLPGSL